MIRHIKQNEAELMLKYHEGKDFPFPNPILDGFALLDEDREPIGFGLLMPQVELCLLLDDKRSKKDKAKAVIDSGSATRLLAKKHGYSAVYISAKDKNYRNILKKHFGLVSVGEILRGDV